jgi:hypothetical protein
MTREKEGEGGEIGEQSLHVSVLYQENLYRTIGKLLRNTTFIYLFFFFFLYLEQVLVTNFTYSTRDGDIQFINVQAMVMLSCLCCMHKARATLLLGP